MKVVASQKVVNGRLRVQIDLQIKGGPGSGDKPGHPFRGNQWEGGSGGLKEDLERKLTDPDSMANGGRPANREELGKVFHQTSVESAVKILTSGTIKTLDQLRSKEERDAFIEEMEAPSDYGEFVYMGLQRKASRVAAIGQGVMFTLDVQEDESRSIVKPEEEHGLLMVHGSVSADRIQSVKIGNSVRESDTPALLAKALKDAGFWFLMDKGHWARR